MICFLFFNSSFSSYSSVVSISKSLLVSSKITSVDSDSEFDIFIAILILNHICICILMFNNDYMNEYMHECMKKVHE
jgi:hypothetical protein